MFSASPYSSNIPYYHCLCISFSFSSLYKTYESMDYDLQNIWKHRGGELEKSRNGPSNPTLLLQPSLHPPSLTNSTFNTEYVLGRAPEKMFISFE